MRLIFLRNTAFGSEYNMTLTDPKTNEKFKAVVDLSRLKLKDFKLVEDTNGEYPYFLKKSQVNITFKFLTRKQEDELKKMEESWNGVGVAPIVTKRVEMMIKSLNGNRDIMQIHNFIENKMSGSPWAVPQSMLHPVEELLPNEKASARD